MISLILAIKIAPAVIAFAFLGLVLAFYVGAGVMTFGIALSLATTYFRHTRVLQRPFFVVGSILSIFLKNIGLVCGAPFTVGNGNKFFASCPILPSVLNESFLVGLIVDEIVRVVAISVGGTVFLITFFAIGANAVLACLVPRKIVSSCEFPLLALGATLERHITRCGIMGLHQKLTFLVSSRSDVISILRLLLLGATPSIIPQMGALA